MKQYLKIIILAFILVCVSTNAKCQTYYYKTTEFAYKYKYNGSWSNWTDWKKSSIKVKIDLDDNIIVIYSPQTQVYRLVEIIDTYNDESNGRTSKFGVIDQDDDYGFIRLRIERNGNSQIYVDFADVMWVYNVVRIYY